MRSLSKTYNPHTVEKKWYKRWEDNGSFHRVVRDGGEAHCIVIPPPNITGILHMGHALNNTIQDVLIRWERMQGKNAIWVPGTDHAGIATQNVVERSLVEKNTTRHKIGRDKFVEQVWKWKGKYGSTITKQLRKLGASCDWERECFTLDENLSRAVQEVFIRLYKKGLIYKGKYIINWCPHCQTALSDEESEHQPVQGKLYHIKYPIKNNGKKNFVQVATTRPETMLGDVAVAINPKDNRYNKLVGETIILPLLNRELKVIEDDYVDQEFGTGVVKVTPAHDPNDFEMGQRHKLENINVMNEDGTMNGEAGPFVGMDRVECRKAILKALEEQGFLVKTDEHSHSVGHCYRCHSVVEPRLSTQWFVKMKPLARPAINAVKDGTIKFVPERWNKVYLDWMENIRDWCISRQVWWGHRIPVFYCDHCDHVWVSKKTPAICPSCRSSSIRQDEDVLDTWFSSWLWPFSVHGWPAKSKDLNFYYPSTTLVTASEIIFFWVARMIMAGMEFMDDIPFSSVYIHGTVRDDSGRKMSKSLGNSIDPLDIIDKYSADALRFSLIMLTATGQDVYISDEKFEIGRNFATKIYNAARYIQMHKLPLPEDFSAPVFDKELLSTDDQHLLFHLQQTIKACTENLSKYRFNDYAKEMYEFLWHKFCDWHVEYSKQVLYGENKAHRENALKVMHHVFSSALRLLHPVMPFITEELWHAMGYNKLSETIMYAPWPERKHTNLPTVSGLIIDYVEAKHDFIRVARILRAEYNLTANKDVNFILKPSLKKYSELLEHDHESIRLFLRSPSLKVDPDFQPPRAMPGGISKLGNIYMPIEGLIDIDSEIKRLKTQLEKVTGDLEKISRKLNNENFINKAPKEVVDIQRGFKKDLLEKSEKLTKLVTSLSGKG